jgi:hypothetical protein
MPTIFDLFSHTKNNVAITYRQKLYNHYQKIFCQVNFCGAGAVGHCTVSCDGDNGNKCESSSQSRRRGSRPDT